MVLGKRRDEEGGTRGRAMHIPARTAEAAVVCTGRGSDGCQGHARLSLASGSPTSQFSQLDSPFLSSSSS